MYRKFLPVALIALFSITMFGCGDDVLSPDDPSMKAKIDGTEKETASVTALKLASSMNITGSFSDGTGITLGLNNITEPTTVDLGTGTSHTGSYFITSTSTTYASTEGEVKIESVDDNGITGTFSFKATKLNGTETVEISDGSFAAKFQ